ncbi:MAG: hypothetical protein JSS55_03670 [Proteobacteria bacterium]|nr:hypothetical protein [Pseudomonadota bacterium]
MLRNLALALSLAAMAGAPAYAAPCRDAHGKFIKCAKTPTPAKAPVRCKGTNGKFVKCGTPGAKPA